MKLKINTAKLNGLNIQAFENSPCNMQISPRPVPQAAQGRPVTK